MSYNPETDISTREEALGALEEEFIEWINFEYGIGISIEDKIYPLIKEEEWDRYLEVLEFSEKALNSDLYSEGL